MRKTFTISYSHAQVAVLDPTMKDPFNRWTQAHVDQGFAWRPRCVCFGCLFGGGDIQVEFILADRLQVGENVTRAIRVPFSVPEHGRIQIGFITHEIVHAPHGEHDLLYEAGGTSEDDQWCRFTLAPASGELAAILKRDPGLRPAPRLNMESEPA